MADNSILPKAQSQLVDSGGRPTRAFYAFFNALVSRFQGQIDTINALVSKLAAVIKALGGNVDDMPDIPAMIDSKADKATSVLGTGSIAGGGNLYGDIYLRLYGDPVDDPPPLSFYGVLSDDGRGWQTYSANFYALDNGDGTLSLDLADLADSGTGAALVKITRDAKGRISGTSSATTTDLAEGANLYFTDERVRTTALTGLSTATATPVTATDSVLVGVGKLQGQASAAATAIAGKEPTITPGTTAQYWRGDKTWRDFATDVRGAVLTGLSLASGVVIAATDTVLGALGKLQAQITANLLPPGYIDGLQMMWVSGTALTVTSGAAYIPSLGKVLRAPAAIAKAGLSLTASTWYHVYFYDNAGTPDAEIVTTAPAAPYNGTARTKTVDTSRRYVGSVKTDASGSIYNFLHAASAGSVFYQSNIYSAPFQVANGSATTPTTASCSAVIPLTGTNASMAYSNNDSVVTVLLGNNSSPPSSAPSFLSQVGKSVTSEGVLPLDGNQAFQYMFFSAPTANFVARVKGYGFER